MRWNTASALTVLLGMSFFYAAVLAAQGPGTETVVVSGSIPRATSLASAAVSSDVEVQSVGSASSNELRVRLHSPQQLPVGLSLLARSNTAYRISVRLELIDGASVPAESGSVVLSSVSSTGERVTAGAIAAKAALKTELKASVNTLLIEGSRISRGGNNSSPDNALRLEFSVILPGGLTAADLILRMDPV